MANEQDIAFRLDAIVNSEGTKSLKDLKKDFSDIQKILSETKQGTKEYQKALEALGATKDDIGDLRDTISALNPEGKVAAFAKVGSTIASGFAAAQGAAALFGSQNKELEKTILKVQSAMALAEGIKGIVSAGDAFKVLNAVMLANPIAAIVVGFTALAGATVAVYNNFFKASTAAEDLQKDYNNLKDSTDVLVKSIDLQIIALSGLKENESKIAELTKESTEAKIKLATASLAAALATEQQAKQEDNLWESTLAVLGLGDEAAQKRTERLRENKKETQKAIDSLATLIAEARKTENIADQKDIDTKAAANKKYLDEKKKALEKDFEDYKKNYKDMDDFRRKIEDDFRKDLHQQNINNRKSLEENKQEEVALDDDLTAQFISNHDKQVQSNKDAETKKRIEKQKTFDTTVNGTKEALQKTQALTDMAFAYLLKQNKGNAEKEKEIRRKQFQVNKAFGVAGSIIDGIGAIQKALNNPYPLNIILAVLTGVLATANTIKIATTKFDGGDSGGSGADSGAMTATAPVIPTPNNTTTKISDTGQTESGNKMGQPVVIQNNIVETEVTNKSKNVARIEETAKFG